MTRNSGTPSKHAICSFTADGLAEFRDWLDRADAAEVKRYTSESPPVRLLHDPKYARQVGYGDALSQRHFDRKYDMGFAVCTAIGPENLRRLMPDANAWAWLSLYLHESTFPFKKGKWFTGVRSRHLVETLAGRKFDQSHRHLVKGAATNVARFGEYATVLMSEAFGMSKIEEQIMSRKVDPPLAFNKELIKALHKLYWDVDADDVKSGAKGDGNGSIMHLEDLLGQFDLTYDINHLQSDRLVRLLPKAFERFQSQTKASGARRRSRPPAAAGVEAVL